MCYLVSIPILLYCKPAGGKKNPELFQKSYLKKQCASNCICTWARAFPSQQICCTMEKQQSWYERPGSKHLSDINILYSSPPSWHTPGVRLGHHHPTPAPSKADQVVAASSQYFRSVEHPALPCSWRVSSKYLKLFKIIKILIRSWTPIQIPNSCTQYQATKRFYLFSLNTTRV